MDWLSNTTRDPSSCSSPTSSWWPYEVVLCLSINHGFYLLRGLLRLFLRRWTVGVVVVVVQYLLIALRILAVRPTYIVARSVMAGLLALLLGLGCILIFVLAPFLPLSILHLGFFEETALFGEPLPLTTVSHLIAPDQRDWRTLVDHLVLAEVTDPDLVWLCGVSVVFKVLFHLSITLLECQLLRK